MPKEPTGDIPAPNPDSLLGVQDINAVETGTPSTSGNGEIDPEIAAEKAALAELEAQLRDITHDLALEEKRPNQDIEALQRLRGQISTIINTRPSGFRNQASAIAQGLLTKEREQLEPRLSHLRLPSLPILSRRHTNGSSRERLAQDDDKDIEGQEVASISEVSEEIEPSTWEDELDRLINNIKTGGLTDIGIKLATKQLEKELGEMVRRGELDPEHLEVTKQNLAMSIEEARQEAKGVSAPAARPVPMAGAPLAATTPTPPKASRRVARRAPGRAAPQVSTSAPVLQHPEVLTVPEDKAALFKKYELLKEQYFTNASNPLLQNNLREEIGILLQRINPGIDSNEKVQIALGRLLSAEGEQKFHAEKERKVLATFSAAKEKVATLQTAEERKEAMSELNDAIDSRIAVTGEDRAAVEHELDVYFYKQYSENELHDLVTQRREFLETTGFIQSEAGKQLLGDLMSAAQEAHPRSKILHIQGLQVRQLIADQGSVQARTTSPRPGLMQKVQDNVLLSMAKKAGSLSGTFAKQGWESAKVVGNARMATDQERIAQHEANRKPVSGRKLAAGALAGTLLLGGIAALGSNSNETVARTAASVTTTAPGVSESTVGATTSIDQATITSAEVTTTVGAPAIVAGEGEVDEGPDEGGEEDGEPDEEETSTTAASVAPPSSDVPSAPALSPDQTPVTPHVAPEAPTTPEGKVGIYETVNINGTADEEGNRWLWHYVEEYVGEQVGTGKIADDDKLGQRFVDQAVQEIVKYNGGRSAGQIDIPTDIILNAADSLHVARSTS